MTMPCGRERGALVSMGPLLNADGRGGTITMSERRTLEGLRARLGQLAREIAKFGVVGGAGVFVNLAVFNLVREFSTLPVVRASIVATVVATGFNYLGYRYFTYRDRDKQGRTKELSLFLLFSAIGLIIENGVLYTATYGFGLDSQLQSNVCKFAGIGVATLFRFWSYRTWVFRTLPAREAVECAESFLSDAPPAQATRKQPVRK